MRRNEKVMLTTESAGGIESILHGNLLEWLFFFPPGEQSWDRTLNKTLLVVLEISVSC